MPLSTRKGDPAVRPWVVVLICLGAIAFDGYDLIVFGSVIPDLLAEPSWGLTPAKVGNIASSALTGMMLGAILCGFLGDRFGRKSIFVFCLAWYSVFSLLTALAPNPESLSVLRFLGGLGYGGIAPVVIPLVIEVAPVAKRNLMSAIVLCGLPLGGVCAALAALALRDLIGFRGLFALGGLALVTVLPAAVKYLPETVRTSVAAEPREPLTGRILADLAVFAVLMFAGFFLVFGLNTWLPQLMRVAGYDLGAALSFQLVLNIGAIFGGLTGSLLADRFNPRLATAVAFLVATASILLLVGKPPLGMLYIVLFAAGAGAIGSQMMVYNFAAVHFPASLRATGIGVSAGLGRLGGILGPTLGGLLLTWNVGFEWSFAVFALTALAAAAVTLLVSRSRRHEPSRVLEPALG